MRLGSISPTCLRTAFTQADSKSAERQSSHQCLSALLKFLPAKEAHITLVKSSPGEHFLFLLFSKYL